MDAGVISSLKRRYRTLKYNRVLDAMDSEDDICSIEQLTAMRYVHSVWLEIPVDIIVSFWRVCNLFGSATRPRSNCEALVASENTAVQSMLFILPSNKRKLSISILLIVEDDEFLELLVESGVAQNIVQELKIELTENMVCSGYATHAGGPLPLKEPTKTVRFSPLIAECQRTLTLQLVHHLRGTLHDLRRQAVWPLRQTTLKSFFSA